jgi:hypothetical protein
LYYKTKTVFVPLIKYIRFDILYKSAGDRAEIQTKGDANMKNKNHGNGQHDEDEAFELILLAVKIVVVISIFIAIATWFAK